MSLRTSVRVLLLGTLAGALGVPLLAAPPAAAAPPARPATADEYSVRDGAPGARPAQAAIGTRTGPAAALVGERPNRPRVAPEVTAAARKGGRVPVIIRLREQVDPASVAAQARHAAAAAGGQGKAVRGRTVVDALRATADRTQGGVRTLLGEVGATDITPYWIFNGFSASVPAAAVDRLAAHPDVASVTLDAEIRLPEAPAGQPRLPTWGVERVKATDVWGRYGFTGKGVVVGIMDGGVDGGHPALAGRYRGRDGDHAHSWFAATGENYPTPGDGHGHGTHVAGTIVGGPPGEVTGVAPDAEWIAAKIFRDSGTTSASIIHAGFQWMLAPGGDPAKAPDVVNNSWGSDATYSTEFWEDVNAWVAAGIFPNFAAGNAGPGLGTVGSPASFPQSFAVGATDIDDAVALFSSRGPATWDGVEHIKPQVSAPGQDIYSTWPRALDPDGYHTISGTSMATPHVTGVIALLLEARPDLSVDAIRELLTSTARVEQHMGAVPNNEYGAGIVDAYAAVTAARFSGTVSGTVRGADGPVAATVEVPDLAVHTRSDPATGFYELRLRAGTWPVRISAYGHVPRTETVTVAVDGQHTLDVTLDPAPVHTVTGTVSGGGGPLADAVVRVAATPLAPVYTDVDGRFSLDIPAGTYEISAESTGYRRAVRSLTVDGDETVDIGLEPLGGETAPQWREFQNNARRTGRSAEPLAPEALTQVWQVRLPGRVLFSSPVIADGRIYLATDNGRLHAVDADNGTTVWTFNAGTNFRTTPAVADGRVFFGGGDDGTFYALDAATGQPLWTYPTGDRLTYASPTVVAGTVYFGTGWGEGDGGWVYALDAATGALRWRTFIGPQIFFGPAVAAGTVFAGSYDARRLVALDAETGAEKWSLTRERDSFAATPTYADGTVYVGTNDFDTGVGAVLAVDAETGAVRWEASGHGDASGSAPVVHGDLVIAGSHGHGWVAAYDRATGERRWVSPAGAAVSNAQLAADGVVIGGSQRDHRAWALDAYTGEVRWQVGLADNITSAPAYADGKLVIAAVNGQLTMFEAPGTLTGVVRDTDGAPLAATVRVPATGVAVTTDPATGGYTLSHRAGTYQVEITSYGMRLQTREVTFKSGRTTTLDATLTASGAGALSGVVTDAAGNPLAGAKVALGGTPLPVAVTGADGRYAFDEVAEGTYPLTVTRDGYAPTSAQVTIVAGESRRHDVALERYQIAVTGDYQDALTRLLIAAGYRVESTTIAAIADRPGDYELIVANGANDDPGAEVFGRLLANADAAGTSIIFLDTWGISYGSLLHLSRYTGDPARTGSGYNEGEVSVIARAGHPLTAGLTPGARVPLLAAGREYAWFADYSGRSVADLYVGHRQVTGSAIGYRPRTQDSVHVLLAAHGVSPWTGPGNGWQPAAHQIFTNAVAYALQASFGTVTGTVTDQTTGAPVAATVTVAATGERTTADADGRYTLLLPAGSYTLRVERANYVTQEVPVTVTDHGTVTVDVALVASGLGALAGTVTSDGAPVAGATVTVGTGLSAVTGPDGSYTVNNVPGGDYELRVTAPGYVTATVPVTVVEGDVNSVDVVLRRALRVAVVGDTADVVDNEITEFLTSRDVLATATGWEALDQLDSYDLVVFHDPDDPGREAFLAALDKLDAAGKSAIFVEGAFSSDGGVLLLRRHLGNPTGRDSKSSAGDPLLHATDPDHPLFAGVPQPTQILVADRWAGYVTGYTGFVLADIGFSETEIVGIGAGYEPRTPTSVRLLLSGLAASFLASPSDGWTEDGKRVFLNAVQWAASPGMGGLQARVVDATGQPVPAVTVTVVETGVGVAADDAGNLRLAHPAGTYTLEVRAFGYRTDTRQVTFTSDRVEDAIIELTPAQVGDIRGVVTDRETGAPLADATVRLDGSPRTAVTGADGRFTLSNVKAGSYTVVAQAPGHVRQVVRDVVVTAGADTTLNVALRPSPTVGVIDDYEGRAKAYLAEWGYQTEDLDWTDVARVDGLDLILANLASYPNRDPGREGWESFMDAVNRADVPVVWLDQFGRGAIRWLTEYEGDPRVRGEDRSDGTVEARVLVDHPLVAGFEVDERVPLTEPGREYGFFTGYSGVTVANLVTGTLGERGGTIGYRGRTAGSVDVLLSTLSISTYGYPPVGGQPGRYWTPQAETLFHNALAWALDAPPLAAEAAGTLRTSAGGAPITGTVTVVETGDTVTARAGDGSYLVPLQPGTWTLRFSAFGHADATRTVTVAAGEAPTLDVTLVAHPLGAVTGTVTDPDGSPVGGASVTLEDTPLQAATGPDGRYTLAAVPVGGYVLRVQAPGYGVQRIPVTVQSGQSATVDVRLAASQVVAVAGDSSGEIGALLAANGYEVRQWSWSDPQNHIGELDEVGLVVLNGFGSSPTAAELTSFLDAAAQAQVSVILAGQYGTGAITAARTARGDPPIVTNGFTANGVGITYRPTVAHPIFAGFEVGQPILLMRHPTGSSQQRQWFAGYSGDTIAAIGDETTGDLGGGVGYRFTSPASVEVLLEGLQAGVYGRPSERWTEQAKRIYLNAVQWALDATQAQITGRVASGGAPVAGAEVHAVDADERTTTGPDGRFRLGVPEGTHTLRVTAFGFEPFETTVTVGRQETVEVSVDLVPVPRGGIAGTVRDRSGAPVAGAQVTATGPQQVQTTTAADGSFTVNGLVPGEYTVTLRADHFVPATASATVVAGQTASVPVSLTPNDVAVLGDVDGVLTAFLAGAGVAAEEIGWGAPVDRYEVVVVNGGSPSQAEFEALVAAADAAEVSLIFTGTWGVDNGGIRLLERYGGGVVTVGGQGYRDGAVGLVDFDPTHPLFADVPEPEAILAPDAYWSGLSHYVGPYLANLSVQGRADAGVAVAYDFRTARSVHLLFSVGGVSGLIGPGYGWTAGTERLMLNAVAWARTAEQLPPAAPTLIAPAAVATPTVTVTGSAEFRSTVTVMRSGAVVATAEPGRDGRYAVEVPLVEGVNVLTARAANHAGTSAPSVEVTVVRDTTGPVLDWTPADRTGSFDPTVTVSGTVADEFAGVATLEVNGTAVPVGPGGAFATVLELVEGENTVTVVATDALGNKRVEVRTVRLFPYSAEWTFAGQGNALNVFLAIEDQGGRPVRADAVTLVIRDASGAVAHREAMSWLDTKYKATVKGLPAGTYTVSAEVDISGWRVTMPGGEVSRHH